MRNRETPKMTTMSFIMMMINYEASGPAGADIRRRFEHAK